MKKKLAYVVATPATYQAFLKGHAKALQDSYDITLIANFADWTGPEVAGGVNKVHVPIQREISLIRDGIALLRLFSHLRSVHYDVVHSYTPKAGLLSNLAGRAAGVGVRIHSFTGQVWATRQGIGRVLLKAMDKLTLVCTTHALSDSPSQVAFLKSEGFAKPILVLGEGGVCGIDTERFRPDAARRTAVRGEYGLAGDDLVFIFLGRLNRDKGILDLVEGFARAALGTNCKLLIVGPDEENLATTLSQHPLAQSGQIVLTGGTTSPERMLCAGDIMCLPSYREGFGSSVLEAAATGLPAIVSRIYGLTDAVVEGETGIMHEVGNVDEVADCMIRFTEDPNLRMQMGRAAYERALRDFNPKCITSELRAFYAAALADR